MPSVLLYSSYFKLHVCWLPSFTPVTYLCKLLGTRSVAAFLQLELFREITHLSGDTNDSLPTTGRHS
ncbi:hypothetical protein B4907_03755 [Yersinia kristensenii]|nr:hypothetical protein B4907_03755 [Yersinia kristensenii]